MAHDQIAAFLALALHHVNGVAVGIVDDGGERQGDDLFGGGQLHLHGAKHPGAQSAVRVLQRGLDLEIARGVIHVGVQGVHRARKDLTRIGVHTDPHRLSPGHLRHILLRQRKVDVNGVEHLQRHHGGAATQELAKTDLPDAQTSVEWRANGPLVNHGLELLDSRVRLLGCGGGSIEIGLGIGALGAQFLGAIKVEPRQHGARLGVGELRLLGRNVLLDQQVPRLHRRARFERDAGDRAVKLSVDDDALNGGQAADRMQRRFPSQFPGFGDRDRRRRRLLRRHGLVHHVAPVKFVAQDASDEEAHREQHQDHSLGHRSSGLRIGSAAEKYVGRP